MPKFENHTVEREVKKNIDVLFMSQGDDEYWTRTALMKVDDLKKVFDVDPENVDEDLRDFALELTGWYGYGACPGQPFAHPPFAKVEGKSRKWVRVVQSGGLDI